MNINGPGFIIDLETRHSVLELRDVGADRYFATKGAEVLCVGWYDVQTKERGVWRLVGDKDNPIDWSDLIYAWPADTKFISFGDFDFIAWNRLFCEVPRELFVDLQVLAGANGLPNDLESVAKALGCAHEKDDKGHRLMLKMCKLDKKTGQFPFSPEMYSRLCEYCGKDVLAEADVLSKLNDFTVESERDVHATHVQINQRGVRVDVPFVTRAAAMAERFGREQALQIMDKYKVSITSRADILAMAKQLGYHQLGGYAKDDVALALADDFLPMPLREVLGVRQLTAYAAVKKYQAFLDRTAPDDILRFQYKMNGAMRTGRWSGAGVQMQNFARGRKDLLAKRAEIIEAVLAGDLAQLVKISGGDPMAALMSALRWAIQAREGCIFVAQDYSAIEARLVLWEAACASLKMFFDSDAGLGPEPYKVYAAMIFGITPDKVDKTQRAIGKETCLGAGYGMGPAKFRDRLLQYGIPCDERLADRCIKETYRRLNPELCGWGNGLWQRLEKAAVTAVRSQGVIIVCNEHPGMAFKHDGQALWFRIPSGRKLRYHGARLIREDDKDQVAYMSGGMEDGKVAGWHLDRTYGGKFTEQCTQATSADLTRDAMVRINKVYPVVMHSHDEIVCEVPEAKAEECKKFMADVMCDAPKWAAGVPIKVDGWIDHRFCKT